MLTNQKGLKLRSMDEDKDKNNNDKNLRKMAAMFLSFCFFFLGLTSWEGGVVKGENNDKVQ